MESANLTEVPSPLKKLVRLIARGFYSMEHAIIVDMLIRHRCVKANNLNLCLDWLSFILVCYSVVGVYVEFRLFLLLNVCFLCSIDECYMKELCQ